MARSSDTPLGVMRIVLLSTIGLGAAVALVSAGLAALQDLPFGPPTPKTIDTRNMEDHLRTIAAWSGSLTTLPLGLWLCLLARARWRAPLAPSNQKRRLVLAAASVLIAIGPATILVGFLYSRAARVEAMARTRRATIDLHWTDADPSAVGVTVGTLVRVILNCPHYSYDVDLTCGVPCEIEDSSGRRGSRTDCEGERQVAVKPTSAGTLRIRAALTRIPEDAPDWVFQRLRKKRIQTLDLPPITVRDVPPLSRPSSHPTDG